MRKVLPLVLVVALLSGCASKYGTAHTDVEYYPTCYRPIQKLRESEHSVTKTTLGGTALGAFGGALIGLLATGKAEGAIAGGVAGAAVGSVIGNIYAKKQKIADENRRMNAYLEDIDGDISHLDIVSATAKYSLQCYEKEFGYLLSDIRARRILRHEAEERFSEISSGRDEAIALLGEAVTHGRDLDQQYEDAFVREEQAEKRMGRAPHPKLREAKAKKREIEDEVDNLSKQQEKAEQQTAMNKKEFERRLDEIDL